MTDARRGLAPATSAAHTLAEHARRLWTPARRWSAEHGDRVFPIVAAALLVLSILFPYWRLRLDAPQYPGGLEASIGVVSVGGDVDEIDGLNHYIGMRPLSEGGELERRLSIFAIPAIAAVAALAALRRKRFWLFALPAIAYPAVFTADLYYWLREFGNNLDDTAALSSSISEFTPTILGPGRVAQFTTWSMYDTGFWMALLGSILLVLAVVIRVRRERGQA
jgi:hypothetical protein